MPFSANGVGWTYYGQREFGADGSFITTEWFIVFYIPIFPLRSYRAISHGRDSIVGPFYQRERYSLSNPMRPNLKQVVSTYAFALAFAGLAAYAISHFSVLTKRFGRPWVMGGIVVGLLAFWFMPNVLRRQAIRRAGLMVVRKRRHR